MLVTTSSDMSSTSGYMGEKYFQEFGPRFLDMSYCQKGSHLQRGVDFCCQTGLHRGGYNYEMQSKESTGASKAPQRDAEISKQNY